MNEPIKVLQSRLNELKATQASLQADLLRSKERPSTSQIKNAAKAGKTEIPFALRELNRKVAEVEEKCILYRTAGWTIFEMDLDVGKRQRDARRPTSSAHSKKALGLGVRLETFHEGRFYEPFYLIFAKSAQLVKNEVKALARLPDDTMQKTSSNTSRKKIRLIRHTIPHFIPLGNILRSYMRSDLNDDEEDDVEGEEIGGLQLLDKLIKRKSLHLFLSQLHAYLQSFISRRQQAIALAQLSLPGLAHSSLRAFGNDSFGQLTLRWDLPTATKKDLQVFEQYGDLLYASKDGRELVESAINSKSQGGVNTSLEVSIVYHNLSSDRVGMPAKPVSTRQQAIQALVDDEVAGSKCEFANILIEIIQSRVPAPRRGDLDEMEKLQIRKTRRIDLELLFTQPENKLPDLQTALGTILQLAWKEEMQRVSK